MISVGDDVRTRSRLSVHGSVLDRRSGGLGGLPVWSRPTTGGSGRGGDARSRAAASANSSCSRLVQSRLGEISS